VAEYRQRARRRAAEFSWEAVADQYERLLTGVYEAAHPGSLPEALLETGAAIAG
jgi:hypothetical protein